ncbi:MAG: hypothetical protein ABI690_00050 [Chloroflexota bacterium]
MNDIETRRRYLTDAQWARTSSSWKEIKPLRDFNQFRLTDETKDQCFQRLQLAGYRIPALVIDQWIYQHYYNSHTVDNYGWIDYREAEFNETSLTNYLLKTLYIIEDYRPYVNQRSQSRPFEDFTCKSEDLEYWKTNGSWRIPPIVLDVKSFSNAPSYAELGNSLQLIEGHTRLGYLLAMATAGILQKQEHGVFILRKSVSH